MTALGAQQLRLRDDRGPAIGTFLFDSGEHCLTPSIPPCSFWLVALYR
jgi:hypothetical protein